MEIDLLALLQDNLVIRLFLVIAIGYYIIGQDVVSSGTLSFGELSLDAVNANITVGYAITYVFGLLGLIILMRLIPRFMGVNLADEAEPVSWSRFCP